MRSREPVPGNGIRGTWVYCYNSALILCETRVSGVCSTFKPFQALTRCAIPLPDRLVSHQVHYSVPGVERATRRCVEFFCARSCIVVFEGVEGVVGLIMAERVWLAGAPRVIILLHPSFIAGVYESSGFKPSEVRFVTRGSSSSTEMGARVTRSLFLH